MCTQNYDQFIATFFSKHFKLISQPKQESTYAPNQALISCFAKITLEQYCHAFCCCFAKSQVKWVILNMQHELKEKETQMGNLTFFNGGCLCWACDVFAREISSWQFIVVIRQSWLKLEENQIQGFEVDGGDCKKLPYSYIFFWVEKLSYSSIAKRWMINFNVIMVMNFRTSSIKHWKQNTSLLTRQIAIWYVCTSYFCSLMSYFISLFKKTIFHFFFFLSVVWTVSSIEILKIVAKYN